MTKVKVKLLATLSRLAGKELMEFEVKNRITLKDLLKTIYYSINDELRERLFKPNSIELQPDILVLINDVEIGVLNGLNTLLNDGDLIVFLPTVHGG